MWRGLWTGTRETERSAVAGVDALAIPGDRPQAILRVSDLYEDRARGTPRHTVGSDLSVVESTARLELNFSNQIICHYN